MKQGLASWMGFVPYAMSWERASVAGPIVGSMQEGGVLPGSRSRRSLQSLVWR